MIFIGFCILLMPFYFIFFIENQEIKFNKELFFSPISFPILLTLFFSYVLIASSFKMFITYSLTKEGLIIFKPPFHKVLFCYRDIENIVLLSEEECKNLIESSVINQNKFLIENDLLGYIKMIRKQAPYYKYFTLAPVLNIQTVGNKEIIRNANSLNNSCIIKIHLKSNNFFFISPENPILFYEEFKKLCE